MVKMLDDHVGLILKKLEELELDNDTIIFFTSDNGHEIYYLEPQAKAQVNYSVPTTILWRPLASSWKLKRRRERTGSLCYPPCSPPSSIQHRHGAGLHQSGDRQQQQHKSHQAECDDECEAALGWALRSLRMG
jgi:arylsulfatase A-like enzyme